MGPGAERLNRFVPLRPLIQHAQLQYTLDKADKAKIFQQPAQACCAMLCSRTPSMLSAAEQLKQRFGPIPHVTGTASQD